MLLCTEYINTEHTLSSFLAYSSMYGSTGVYWYRFVLLLLYCCSARQKKMIRKYFGVFFLHLSAVPQQCFVARGINYHVVLTNCAQQIIENRTERKGRGKVKQKTWRVLAYYCFVNRNTSYVLYWYEVQQYRVMHEQQTERSQQTR